MLRCDDFTQLINIIDSLAERVQTVS